ncbi:ATP-binding protein [Streptomyces sp. 35G-GA-8]|uniref:AAA family ATPase n=1 Tax=Streptomyces sp. 35G-GA-8 TaxID=2939434 RepID=UPI00201EE2BC|nr:ATP-binding protein [Streptomyces sp. 35G-GA-8]MCL7380038.1 ATP-binding protein [Streptomyces sp. 35G-GA-8]
MVQRVAPGHGDHGTDGLRRHGGGNTAISTLERTAEALRPRFRGVRMKESPGHRFIGRADELGILWKAARDAVRENPRVVIVSGAAGMGKTALVNRFTAEAGEEFMIVRARDVPPKTDLPFYTVTGLLADGGAESSPRHRYAPSPAQPSVLSMGGAVIELLGSSGGPSRRRRPHRGSRHSGVEAANGSWMVIANELSCSCPIMNARRHSFH